MPCLSADLPAPYNGEPSPNLSRILEIDKEIGLLSAHLNAANCRLLELIAEFDELGGYADQGAMSCAHWLNWKCGISLNAAREKLRTAKALGQLPQIKACFAAGRISYSKVRAMTRVGTPENEDVLLNIALHGTASHVEKLVRGYRWRIKVDEEAADEQKRQDNRCCYALWQEDGSLKLTANLAPEYGALMRACTIHEGSRIVPTRGRCIAPPCSSNHSASYGESEGQARRGHGLAGPR